MEKFIERFVVISGFMVMLSLLISIIVGLICFIHNYLVASLFRVETVNYLTVLEIIFLYLLFQTFGSLFIKFDNIQETTKN